MVKPNPKPLLPYIAFKAFNNTLATISRKAVEQLSVVENAYKLFTPVSSAFTYVQYLGDAGYKLVETGNNQYIGLADVDDAAVAAYLPSGEKIVFRSNSLSRCNDKSMVQYVASMLGIDVGDASGKIYVPIKALSENINPHEVNDLIRRDIRLRGGTLLGGVMKAKYGISLVKLGEKELVVRIRIGRAIVEEPIKVRLYADTASGKTLYTSYASYVISNLNRFAKPEDLYAALDIVRDIVRTGFKTTGVTKNYLQSTRGMRFRYILGRMTALRPNEAPDTIFLGSIAARRIYGAVRAVRSEKSPSEYLLRLDVRVYPDHSPAALVYNLAPLNLAPLLALLHERPSMAGAVLSKAVTRLRRMNIHEQSTWYRTAISYAIRSGITPNDIYRSIRGGYPEPEMILGIADKVARGVTDSGIFRTIVFGDKLSVDTKIIESLLEIIKAEHGKLASPA